MKSVYAWQEMKEKCFGIEGVTKHEFLHSRKDKIRFVA